MTPEAQQPASTDPSQLPEGHTRCVVCRSPLLQGARKCVTCDSYQHPLRNLLAGIDIQGLVALIPIATLAFVFLRDQMMTPKAEMRLASLSCAGDSLTLAVANIGNRDALFAGAYISGIEGQSFLLNIDLEEAEPLIPPKETRIYELRAIDAAGNKKGLGLSQKRPCDYEISPRSLSLTDAVENSSAICACPEAT